MFCGSGLVVAGVGGVEGVLDEVNFWGALAVVGDDGDDVEAYGAVDVELFYVGVGCFDEAADFDVVDGFLGVFECGVAACFYFYDG